MSNPRLLTVTIVLLAAGSVLLVQGYLQGQPTATTGTESVTMTSTSVSSQQFSTALERALLSDFAFTINGISGTSYSCLGEYITERNNQPFVFGSGQIRVKYSSTLPVDFLVVTPAEFETIQNTPPQHANDCSALTQTPAVFSQWSSTSYDEIIQIPASGQYYLYFLTSNEDPVSVTISVVGLSQTTGVNYVTQTITFATTRVTSNLQSTGPGLTFYLGIFLLGGTIVFLTFSRKRGGAKPVKSRLSYCTNCRAKLPADAEFCGECGHPVKAAA